MFLYMVKFEDNFPYYFEQYNEVVDFIEKSNKKGHWRIYANIVKDRFDLIDEFNNKEPIECDLPKSFTKDGVTITLEKDINNDFKELIQYLNKETMKNY